jgi:hypothetical protein
MVLKGFLAVKDITITVYNSRVEIFLLNKENFKKFCWASIV